MDSDKASDGLFKMTGILTSSAITATGKHACFYSSIVRFWDNDGLFCFTALN